MATMAVTEVDRSRKAWLASCQPMLTVLRRFTLNVEQNRPSSLPVKILFANFAISNTYNCLVFTSGVSMFVSSILNSDEILFRPLNFNEPLFTFSLMVSFVVRRRHIARLIDDIVHLTSSLDDDDDDDRGLGRKECRRTSVMLASVTCLYLTIHFLIGLFLAIFIHKDRYVLDTFYFGIKLPEEYELPFLRFDIIYYFVTVYPYNALQGMLQIFVFSLLSHCFRQLNRSVKTLSRDPRMTGSCGVVYAVLRKHRQIAALVTRVNGLFSLSIFCYVIAGIFRVVIALKFLAFQKKTFSMHDYTAMYFGGFFSVVTLLMFTLWYACEIHVEARNTTKMLLKLNLESVTCCYSRDKRRMFSECHVTPLYLAQQTVLPVGIRFGHLFYIDYHFVIFVFSTIVTYLTAISAVE